MKNFWIQFAVASMSAAGIALKAQDANNTGADDMEGNLLVGGSNALTAYLRGDIKGYRGALKTIADGINAFLANPE